MTDSHRGITINSAGYCELLRRSRHKIQRRLKRKWSGQVLLLCDIARPQTSRQTVAELDSLGFTVLPPPPYSPDLAQNDYVLFDAKKNSSRGQRFKTNKEFQEGVVCHWMCSTSKILVLLKYAEITRIKLGGEYFEHAEVLSGRSAHPWLRTTYVKFKSFVNDK